MRRLATLFLCFFALAGCSSLGGLSPGGGDSAPAVLSADLGAALFAVDMPAGVEPIPPGPRLVVTVPGGSGLEAVLVRADAEPVMTALPPPAQGRTYHVFALTEADRAAFAALQRRLAGATSPAATVSIAPSLCVAAGIDPAREGVSVHPVLNGIALQPLLSNVPLASLRATLPIC